MHIAGLQKLTLLDYPGKTAATVFTAGCNFNCPFCHNAELVTHIKSAASTQQLFPFIPEDEFYAFLDKRQGLLDGICITGGEPTLQPDLAEFCTHIKAKGFLVKLDTNGSRPEILHSLLQEHLVDYIAMDIKNSPESYYKTIGIELPTTTSSKKSEGNSYATNYSETNSKSTNIFENPNTTLTPTNYTSNQSALINAIEKSMCLLLAGTIPFEFRTTVVAELHTKQSLKATANWIAHLGCTQSFPETDIPWFLQQFTDSDTVLAGEGFFTSWNEADIQALLPLLQAVLPKTELRGL